MTSSNSAEISQVLFQRTPDSVTELSTLYIVDPGVAKFSVDAINNTGSDMYFGDLRVDKKYRLNGYATRLFSALAGLALHNNYTGLCGSVDSQYTLRIIRKLFDEESVQFKDYDPTSDAMIELPLSIEQAIGSLERAEAFEEHLEYRDFGFEVSISLAGLKSKPEPITEI